MHQKDNDGDTEMQNERGDRVPGMEVDSGNTTVPRALFSEEQVEVQDTSRGKERERDEIL